MLYVAILLTLQEGRTAIHYAAVNGYANIVSLLAAEGCDIDSQDNVSVTIIAFNSP